MKMLWNRGSQWHRWDPHVHTPGTVLNNQFHHDWSAYFDAIEKKVPTVEAIGVTDYCTIAGYKEFLKNRAGGRAQNIKFAFPNVEFRLGVQTERKRGINLHLLFSPDDPNHVREVERLLGQLKFDYKGRSYGCSQQELTEFGRAMDPRQSDDAGAFKVGVEQFKLDLQQLRRLFAEDQWMRDNCLVAVEAGETDGTAGLQKDGAFKALREELEAFANIIFSPRESDRQFWLGQKPPMDREAIERSYRSLKPCLHGSDAHHLDEVLAPQKERYCWIRADLTFVGLRQTLLEPAARVHIGPQPPAGPAPSECIARLTVGAADWLETPAIDLNSGLVAIIGPKGSGKTALADLIAHAAGATINDGASFLLKASDLLGAAEATLSLEDGTKMTSRRLENRQPSVDRPLVRYLSQQFVDRLCSSEGMAGELLDEIEAVVFQAVPDEERLGATAFAELRNVRLGEMHDSRDGLLSQIQEFTDRISAEEQKKAKLPALVTTQAALAIKITKGNNDLQALVPKDKKKEAEEHDRLQVLIDAKDNEHQSLKLRQARLIQLGDAYDRLMGDWHRGFESLKAKYEDVGIDEKGWEAFRPTRSKTSGTILSQAAQETQKSIDALVKGDPAKPKDLRDPATWPLGDLRMAATKLRASIGVEADRAKKHVELQKQQTTMKLEDARLIREIEDAKQSDARRKKSVEERRDAYAAVFDLLAREEKILEELYAPLRARLASGEESGTKRLDFHVRRNIDLDAWVTRGEDLLDLRKVGPFQGHGKLAEVARSLLLPAWKSGDAAAVGRAMETFLGANMRGLADSRLSNIALQDVGRWLFSTDHVSLAYGIRYDGQEISTLSPGMRGIVLLMLYLAVDQWDLRPLIVDQPEENLDPQSVYDELVRYFRDAKLRRQVILVTHNPNLVVNADADQVIVATSRREGAGLPQIRYSSGGLEDAQTRTDVCRILEGGERAFREREQRYAFAQDLRLKRA